MTYKLIFYIEIYMYYCTIIFFFFYYHIVTSLSVVHSVVQTCTTETIVTFIFSKNNMTMPLTHPLNDDLL